MRSISTPVARILGQAEDQVDPVGLAPSHERLAAEVGVGANDDLDLGPLRADLRDDATELRDTTGGCFDVGCAQPRALQALATQEIQRQVEIVTLAALEEAPLLLAVDEVLVAECEAKSRTVRSMASGSR
jgi:hypothetical protein